LIQTIDRTIITVNDAHVETNFFGIYFQNFRVFNNFRLFRRSRNGDGLAVETGFSLAAGFVA
jgi:hypothetical protein